MCKKRKKRCAICLTVYCCCRHRKHRHPRRRHGPSAPCGNLVRNGSFTYWAAGDGPRHWDTVENVDRNELPSLVYTYPYAARVGADASTPARLGQTIYRAKPGFCYRFEFQMMTGIEQIAEVFFDDTVVATLNIAPTSGTGRFSYYSVYTPPLPRGATMRILFTKPNLGLFSVDDVAVSAAGKGKPRHYGGPPV